MEQVGQNQALQVPNYSGVNIQIFNPSVAPPGAYVPPATVNTTNYTTTPMNSYPANYYTQNLAQNVQVPPSVQGDSSQGTNNKKMQKREIVELTDEYLKTMEGYLNNKDDKKVRLMAAKEVLQRLQEDDSRKNDPALNALINKMLQDPSQPVKFIAMAALQSRVASGNDLTVKLVKDIQKQSTGYGEDSLMASDILLKMSGKQVEKEFEVKESYQENPKDKGEQA